MELNQEFLIEVLYSYCKRPIYRKYQNLFNAECPVCKEGKSSGRSRRLFYFPNKQYIFCHNCSKSWKPFEWVREITGLSVPEIISRNRIKTESIITTTAPKPVTPPKPIATLPEGSIEITNKEQLEFYKDNKIVNLGLEYCKSRRLLSAINSCKKFYVSLEDKSHKNRLIIPFFNNKQITCYQSRALFSKQTPKYKTKIGEKELFNYDNINSDIPYIFIFEGPIDSMFVQNGVAMASLSPTEAQRKQLNSLIGYQQIFVFDNDKNNEQTSRKIEKFIKQGSTIFIWPKELKQFKDFNELCVHLKQDEVPWKFVVNNSFSGNQALLKFKLNS